MMRFLKYIAGLLIINTIITSCILSLDEEVYSDLSSNNFYKTEKDLESAMYGIYKGLLNSSWDMFAPGGNSSISYLTNQSCDQFFLSESWGGVNPSQTPGRLHWFQWNADEPAWLFDIYDTCYTFIAAANLAIEKIPDAEVNDSLKLQFIAEAKALRALYYSVLHSLWGNVPTVDKYEVNINSLPRQDSSKIVAAFIEKDLTDAIPYLPDENFIGTSKYGRIHKAGAQALLAKLYLNTKQWEKAASICESIINNAKFGLAYEYSWIFDVDNHQPAKAQEMLLVIPCNTSKDNGNNWDVHALPYTWPGLEGWNGYFVYRSFYNTFDSVDIRRKTLLTEWTDKNGNKQIVADDRCIPYKYTLDPNYIEKANMGNDVPIIRMADIYLARAEALNELNGLNQESIDLVNAVRKRAFEPDKPVYLSDFLTKESLRNHILRERGWELWCEAGIRREDLIRHGKFIQQAIDRGIEAKPYQVLYPIPRYELDRNPNMKQNSGYAE
jgi:hypothetical protein